MPEPALYIGILATIGLAVACAAMNIAAQLGLGTFGRQPLAVAGLSAATLRKAARLSQQARHRYPDDRVFSVISTDVGRIGTFCRKSLNLVQVPATLLAQIVVLIALIGPTALVGLAVVAVNIPLQVIALHGTKKLRSRTVVHTDARLRRVSEAVRGMRLVKSFAWEKPSLDRIDLQRALEVKLHARRLSLHSLSHSYVWASPVLAAVAAFSVRAFIGGQRQPDDFANVFAAFSSFSMLMQPLLSGVYFLTDYQAASQAADRLGDFLLADEQADDAAKSTLDPEKDVAVSLRDASFSWISDDDAPAPFQLRGLDLQVQRGELLAIVGQVASGKSSLCRALLGEMRRVGGEVAHSGRFSYASQIAIVWSASVRENVLFGEPYDAARYSAVLDAVALSPDLALFADGDATVCGELGRQLSGGQAARVGLARAIYARSDIVILDDVFSALDAPTGRHVFERAVRGLLADRTVILVTHATWLLPQCDRILVMDGGRIVELGAFDELAAKGIVAEQGAVDKKAAAKVSSEASPEAKLGSAASTLLVDERASGAVPLSVYTRFLAGARSTPTLVWLGGSIVLALGTQALAAIALSWWQGDTFNRGPSGTRFYITIFACVGLANAVAQTSLKTSLITTCLRGSQNLHASAMRRIMRAPMAWFDQTLSGRILARFSHDAQVLDYGLTLAVSELIVCYSAAAVGVIIIAVIQPWGLIALALGFVAVAYAVWVFLPTSRAVRRLSNVNTSSAYALIGETLAGMPTILAFGQTGRFVAEVDHALDRVARVDRLGWFVQAWIGCKVNWPTSILALVVGFLAVFQRHQTPPVHTALALTALTGLFYTFGWATRCWADLESDANSMQRLQAFCTVPQESISAATVPAQWPERGEIEFRNVTFRHRPELPTVLHDISFTVHGGERLGVIGKSGAGKTNLLTALLRLAELDGGRVEIDGVDAGKIGLTDLRSRVALLPQHHFCVAGSIRANLDPFGQYDDAQLNQALQRARLTAYSLDTMIEPDGANLSVGERALVSLARALVKRSSILLLDEPTSSVDADTDAFVQHAIRTEFADRTIVAIAHRLRSVLAFDRILVMDAGTVAELGRPLELFDRGGQFAEICRANGVSRADVVAAASSE